MVPNGVLPLPDLGLAASWAFSDAIRVWSVETGEEQVEFAHHRDVVGGVLRLGDGRLVSWSADGTIWTWSIDGASPPQMAVHPVVSSRCAVLGGPQQLVLSGAWSVPLFVHCEPVARFADDGQARLARPPAP